MNLKKLNKIILLIVLFVMLWGVSVNASVEKVFDFTFDSETYANSYSDLKAAFGSDVNRLREHFANYGVKEGRTASPIFDVVYYVAQYKDLQQAYGTDYEKAYNHFVNYGVKEGRKTSPVFDVVYYVSQYKDLQQAYGTDYEKAFQHFANYGMAEGRKTSANFDVVYYVSFYKDLQQAYGTDYEKAFNHYLNYGITEGRVAIAPKVPTKPVEPEEPSKPEHTHNYTPDFKWSEDKSVCQLILICQEDNSHKIELDMDVTSEVKQAADCKENKEGIMEYTASKEYDGKTYKKTATSVIPVDENTHDYSVKHTIIAATCDEEGTEYHTCSKCSAVQKNEDGKRKEFVSPALNHEGFWKKDAEGNEIEYKEEATCVADGYLAKYCLKCGELKTIQTYPHTGHDYKIDGEINWVTYPDATKKPRATATLVCTNNPSEKVKVTATVELTSSNVATCTVDGQYVYTATIKYTDNLNEEHTFTETKTLVEEATHKDLTTETKTLDNGDTQTKTTCSVCGLEETEITHNAGTKNRTIKEATCSETGIDEYLCDNCGETYDVETVKTEHSTVKEGAVAPNCETGTVGNIEYLRCTVCDKYFNAAGEEITKDDIKVLPTHTLTRYAAKDKTCIRDGNIEYWKCTVCHQYFSDEEGNNKITLEDTIIAKGHEPQLVAHKEATCTEPGNIEHYKCTVCNKLFADVDAKVATTVDKVTIAQKAHDYIHHDAIAPICTEAGNDEYYTCKICDNYFNASKAEINEIPVLPKTGTVHKLTHEKANPADCTTNGNIEYWSCENCGKNFTAENATQVDVVDNVIIPARHTWVIVGTKADCEYATVYCSNKDCQALYAGEENAVSVETLITDKSNENTIKTEAEALFGEDFAQYIPSKSHDTFTETVVEDGKKYEKVHCNICNKDLSSTEIMD